MKLQENINRIKSMMGLTESKMVDGIQSIIDNSLEELRDSTSEMGLGEMDELDEIESVDEMKVTNFTKDDIPIIYVDLYVNTKRRNFDNIIANMEYDVNRYIPKSKIILNNIIDNRTFGPGIDW